MTEKLIVPLFILGVGVFSINLWDSFYLFHQNMRLKQVLHIVLMMETYQERTSSY